MSLTHSQVLLRSRLMKALFGSVRSRPKVCHPYTATETGKRSLLGLKCTIVFVGEGETRTGGSPDPFPISLVTGRSQTPLKPRGITL